jgi:quinohemoprotein ethanol dehydrogenase
MISSAEAFNSIVLEGAYLDKGMASFAEALSPTDTETIRAYLVNRTHE